MIRSGRARAWLLGALWTLLVVTLFAGVSAGPIALLWNGIMIVTAVFTGLWAAEWWRWRSRRGVRR